MALTIDIEKALIEMSMADKIKLLAGDGWWHTEPVPKHGIPSVRMSDGPNGVRGTRFFNGVPSSCFPSSTGLGSSFDVNLATKVGKQLGEECRAKSTHILLGPTVNTQRSPLGGRGFESFSEDPHLNGVIAGAYINGVQSTGVASTIKHFVANDQEYQRFSISSEVSERALREIYMMPFQIAIKEANPWALMTAYNRINGLHCSENPWLIHDILRKEWGWKGMIMSDWIGVYSTAESIKAGLDLEMPYVFCYTEDVLLSSQGNDAVVPPVMRGLAVARALIGEKLFPEDIDARVRKILEIVNHAAASGIPFNGPENSIDTPETRALLRKAAAEAIVLLKNEKRILPLGSAQNLKRIAVIGPNAKDTVISGGGSAALRPTYTVSPLEGITIAAKAVGAEVNYAVGAITHKYLPVADPLISKDGQPGALFEFWNELPSEDYLEPNVDLFKKLPTSAWTTPTASANCLLADGIDESKVNEICWLRYTTTFTPDEDGDWELGLSLAGRGNVFIDGKLAINLSTDPPRGTSFFGMGTAEVRTVLKGLEAGVSHTVEVRSGNPEFIAQGPPFACRGGLRLGAVKKIDDEEGIRAAVELAKDSDAVILVVGLNNDWESEGHDRNNMDLPGLTNVLVSEVLKANPKTIVVNQTGTPVGVPWINEAHTLLQAFYGGNEVGNGLADILFGSVNPSGKLPLTFPRRLEDNPSYPSYSFRTDVYGKVLYNEGIFVGYRGYEIKKAKPLFPFGYGLSYTTFDYSDLSVSPISPEGEFTVSFTIRNTGNVDGREIAQVYIADPESTLPRPVKELKGFTKVAVKAEESKNVTVKLDRLALSFYDERRGAWVAEAGKFDVLVAVSSEDVKLTGQVELLNTLVWTGL